MATGARNLVIVILDSLRYDSWVAAEPETLSRLGPVERRWSYATWTAPSHYNLLMGLLPHTSPPEVYASEYYKQDFLRYSERLGLPDIEFKRLDDQPQPGDAVEFFDQSRLRQLHARQVEAVRYLDGVFARLFDLLPDDTWVIVTSDHGELFGEERYFGHGPIMHEKVLEVPFVEGLVP